MNNRFKFKVWDKINNKWMPHRLLDITNGFLTEFYDEEQAFNRRYVLAQCTGLKDRNGKLIYEGDIVKCDRDFFENGRKNLIRKVIFADGSFQLERAKTIGDRYYINAFHNFEIIGNVHTGENK